MRNSNRRSSATACRMSSAAAWGISRRRMCTTCTTTSASSSTPRTTSRWPACSARRFLPCRTPSFSTWHARAQGGLSGRPSLRPARTPIRRSPTLRPSFGRTSFSGPGSPRRSSLHGSCGGPGSPRRSPGRCAEIRPRRTSASSWRWPDRTKRRGSPRSSTSSGGSSAL